MDGARWVGGGGEPATEPGYKSSDVNTVIRWVRLWRCRSARDGRGLPPLPLGGARAPALHTAFDNAPR